jgi:hypothetical protein
VSLPKEKAEEILDLCLSNESSQMRTKVYEILSLSGIKPNDPMFLVLALTGQMRVLLETAPTELGKLLKDWKFHSSKNIAELLEVIESVQIRQEEQNARIKGLVDELAKIQLQIEAERKSNIKLMQSLIKGMAQTYADLDQINAKIQNSISSLDQLKVAQPKKWMIAISILVSGLIIIAGSLMITARSMHNENQPNFSSQLPRIEALN